MKYDYSKLYGRLAELDIAKTEFAKALGISYNTLLMRFNNKRYFTQNEMLTTLKLFNEPIENIGIYFFTEKVK